MKKIYLIIILISIFILIYCGINNVQYHDLDRMWVNKYNYEYYQYLKPLIVKHLMENNNFPQNIIDLRKYQPIDIYIYRNGIKELLDISLIEDKFNIIPLKIDNLILYKIEGKLRIPEYYDKIENTPRYIIVDSKLKIYPQYSSPIHIQKYIFWGKIKSGIIKQNIDAEH